MMPPVETLGESIEPAVQGAAGQFAVMLAVFDPKRHGGLVELLRDPNPPAGELG
jgi:hypothetical protein